MLHNGSNRSSLQTSMRVCKGTTKGRTEGPRGSGGSCSSMNPFFKGFHPPPLSNPSCTPGPVRASEQSLGGKWKTLSSAFNRDDFLPSMTLIFIIFILKLVFVTLCLLAAWCLNSRSFAVVRFGNAVRKHNAVGKRLCDILPFQTSGRTH